MTGDFDPYYKWLGIPPTEQPPNHYRLLGIPLLTEDADVISHAADQRMAHIRSFQMSANGADSQRLLSELSAARVCLLNPSQKAEYDAAIQNALATKNAPAPAVPPVQPTAPPTALPETTAVRSELPAAPLDSMVVATTRSQRNKNQVLGPLLAGGVILVVLVGWGLLRMVSQADPPQLTRGTQDSQSHPEPSQNPEASATEDDPSAKAPIETTVTEAPDEPEELEPPSDSTDGEAKPTNEETVAPAAETDQDKEKRLTTERDAALETGDLQGALTHESELAQLLGKDPIQSQASLVLNSVLPEFLPNASRIQAAAFVTVVEQALEAEQTGFAKANVDNLLRLARDSGDDDLIRRATRLVLKVRSQ